MERCIIRLKLSMFLLVSFVVYMIVTSESYGALISHKVSVTESEDGRIIYEDAKGEKYDITSLKGNYLIYDDRLIINCRFEFDISCVSGEDWLSESGLKQSYNIKQGTDKKFKSTVIDDAFIASADGNKRIDFYVNNIVRKMKLDNKVIFVGETRKLDLKIDGNTSRIGGVEWKSSDESVVSVDTSGNITTHKEGEAIISATVKYLPEITTSCKVIVVVEPKETADELLGIDKQIEYESESEKKDDTDIETESSAKAGAKDDENDNANKDNEYVIIFIVSTSVFAMLAVYGIVRLRIRKAKKN